MTDDEFFRRLKAQYQRKADYASAHGAAEQCGVLAEFDQRMKDVPDQDPWELVRTLLRSK